MRKHFQLPSWFRVLVWGLIGSVLLHWVMLDFLRGTVSLSLQGDSSLQVRLSEPSMDAASSGTAASAEALRDAAVDSAAEPVRRASAAGVSRAPEPSATQRFPSARAVPESLPATNTPAEFARISMAGLRSGSREEALIGMRLALAEALGPLQMSASVLVWCDFDAVGQLRGLRSDVSLPKAELLRLQQLASRLAVPAALLGQDFVLDLAFDQNVGGGSRSMVRN